MNKLAIKQLFYESHIDVIGLKSQSRMRFTSKMKSIIIVAEYVTVWVQLPCQNSSHLTATKYKWILHQVPQTPYIFIANSYVINLPEQNISIPFHSFL